jgi:hypothetical protein
MIEAMIPRNVNVLSLKKALENPGWFMGGGLKVVERMSMILASSRGALIDNFLVSFGWMDCASLAAVCILPFM